MISLQILTIKLKQIVINFSKNSNSNNKNDNNR